jgi:hypothetical protein
MKKNYATLLMGLSLCLPVIPYFRRQEGFDLALYPHPVLVLVPMLLGLRWAAFAVPSVCFFLWNQGLFRGEGVVPRRSHVLLIIVALLSALWFALGWKDGMAIQGAAYCRLVFSVNIACIGILFSMFAYSKKTNSFAINLLCHWILFLWLSWYAFPFFGEFL